SSSLSSVDLRLPVHLCLSVHLRLSAHLRLPVHLRLSAHLRLSVHLRLSAHLRMSEHRSHRREMTMVPLKVWTVRRALASPKEPRMARLAPRRDRPDPPSARSVTGKSDRTLPLKVVASRSKPVSSPSVRRTSPEWELNS